MNREPRYIDEMLWVPEQRLDETRLRALAGRFGKPSEPLGEAWFMGDTRYLYDDLNAGGIEAVSDEYVIDAFDEMVSGMGCFFEMDVWAQWYAYLTPRILLSERFLPDEHYSADFSQLWDGLMTLSWYSQADYVRRSEADFARVLAPLITHPMFWRNGQFYDPHHIEMSAASWGVWSLSSHFATSMLLSWRYLHPSALQPWLFSVLAIEDAEWRAQFLLWLQAVRPIFALGSAYDLLWKCDIESLWPGSYLWGILAESRPERAALELIPKHNIATLRSAIARHFDEPTFFSWIDFFAARPEMWPDMEVSLDVLQETLDDWKRL